MRSHSFLIAGRLCFAAGILSFGARYLTDARFSAGLPPAPPWTPGAPWSAYLLGIVLLLSGLVLLVGFRVREAAALVGSICVGCAVLLHTWHFGALLRDGNARTGALEALALGAAAWVLSAIAVSSAQTSALTPAQHRLETAGRLLFAFTMAIFGEQHFQYARFVATLVPAWIPGHLFWIYFTGTAFFAAAISLAADRWTRAASFGLAAMFFGWFLLLHVPRVAAAPHAGDEWTSAFVALALGGGSLVIAAAATIRG